MAIRYRAALRMSADRELSVAAFTLEEGYNAGWGGTAAVALRSRNGSALSAPEVLGLFAAWGATPGAATALEIVVDGGPFDGVRVRSWPVMISCLRPGVPDRTGTTCEVRLTDPVGYLAERPVWGAYRAASAAEMVGGALSLAAGGDGKPTLTPALPGMPRVEIVERYREKLARLPYAIAAGQTLGDWLSCLLGMLGLRAELSVEDDDGPGSGGDSGSSGDIPGRALVLTLSDRLPSCEAFPVTVLPRPESAPAAPGSVGRVAIRGHSTFSPRPLRGALLDDPSKGGVRALGKSCAVGTVICAPELDVDEAETRIRCAADGAFAEMMMLKLASRLPQFRHGSRLRLDSVPYGIEIWQVAALSHAFHLGVYDNDATVLRADVSWHPDLPPPRAPVVVTGSIDGGDEFDYQEPVPRDRLGRIKVSFPFTPTQAEEEEQEGMSSESDIAPQGNEGDDSTVIDDGVTAY